MLNTLRRKRLQRIAVVDYKYLNKESEIWWHGYGVGYGDLYSAFGMQRYQHKEIKKPFTKNAKHFAENLLYARDYISSMIFCPSSIPILESEREHWYQTEETEIEIEILKPFLLGATKITQELYKNLMGVNPSEFKDNPKNPVENVSWYDAIKFCNQLSMVYGLSPYYKIGKPKEIEESNQSREMILQTYYPIKMNEKSKGFRLPTEWEWEYAAKAGTNNRWSGTDVKEELEHYAWYNKNSNNTTHPVKGKKPNEWGFYDMIGNVWEWCENVATFEKGNEQKIDVHRVSRGMSWKESADELTMKTWWHRNPCYFANNMGFRIARYI